MTHKSIKCLVSVLALCILAFASVASAAPYSATGAGSSNIGTGGDYASLAAACAAISGTTNNNVVTSRSLTTNVATLTLQNANTFVANQSITVNIGDPIFDGTFTVSAVSGTDVSYARTNANVVSGAATGTVYTTSGSGTRDASAWTFYILNDLTENVNSEIRCTVNAAGSITFKPAASTRPTVTWPATIKANSQSSGHVTIGATNGGSTIQYTSTQNIIFDGSNTNGGTTRDMVFQNQDGDLEGAIGIIRVRGNCDGITVKNMIMNDPNNSTATPQAITFTTDWNATDGNKAPDNWTVDNCLFSMSSLTSSNTAGSSIACATNGTAVSGTAQSGYSITNNVITGGSRAIYLTNNGSGTIRGNTINTIQNGGFLGAAINHTGANSATGITMTVDKNNIASQVVGNSLSGGDFGNDGMTFTPPALASTFNITNNMIGGWTFGGTSGVDGNYHAIGIRGAATGSTAAVFNIEHNTINMTTSTGVMGQSAGRVAAIHRSSTTTPPTLNIKNNIIRMQHAGVNAVILQTNTTGNITANGNALSYATTIAQIGQPGAMTVTNKSKLSNVATLTLSGTPAVAQGMSVNVILSPADANFDGAATITNVVANGANTNITYTKNGANVTSAASGGTINGANNLQTYTVFGPAATAGTWQNAGYDANGQNVDVSGNMVLAAANSTNNLHFATNPGSLAATGVATALSTDIDGQARDTTGLAIPGADVYSAPSPTTYTWNATGSASFSTAANWTPARTTPSYTDTLVFDGSQTAGALVVTDVQDQQLAGLQIINSANVNLQTLGGYARLSFLDGAGTELQVGAGSVLTLGGAGGGIQMELGGGATGQVDGDVVIKSSTQATPNRILCKSTGALVFTNGSSCQHLPSVSGTGAAFGGFIGESVVNGVTFQSGSTWHNGATAAGVRGGSAPSNPFAFTAPNSAVNFQSGSTFVNWMGTPAVSNRTYNCNFVWRNDTSASVGGASAWTLNGNFTTANSNTTGQGTFTNSGAGAVNISGNFTVASGGPAVVLTGSAAVYSVAGNVDIQDASLFTPPSSSAFTLNGSSNQNVNFAGKDLNALTVNNAAGITLTGNVGTSGVLTLTAGTVNTNGNTFVAADGAANVVRTSGMINGSLTRLINSATTGARLFPVSTGSNYAGVNVNITGAGVGSGTLTVSSTAGDQPNVLDASGSLDRFWTLTANGIDLSAGAATLDFSYQAADVTGTVTEATMVAGRYTGVNGWQEFPGTTVNTGTHVATVTGVTGFSPWTLGNAASLPVHVTGFSID